MLSEPVQHAAPSASSNAPDGIADPSDLITVFQPIVSLDDEKTVGFEALSRWSDVGGTSPEQMFTHAGVVGACDELDQHCIRHALDTALTLPLPDCCLLLINTEPTTLLAGSATDRLLTDGSEKFQLIFELTERSLWRHPRALLTKVATLRAHGIGIAVDDVGRDLDVLAWLDVIDPEVVKLDLSLIQAHPAPEQARMLTAVYSHHERSDAVIIAEGIETEDHLDQARAVGATLGQGYRFGRPAVAAQVAAAQLTPSELVPRVRPLVTGAPTPFELVRHSASVRVARKQLLAAFSRDIETQAERAADRPLVLSSVQHVDHLPARQRDRYRRLAQSCALVAVFGRKLPEEIAPGVTPVSVPADDPLVAEWTIIVLGSHIAYALIARESPIPAERDSDRRFEFVLTTDRTVVALAATTLLSRVP